MRKAGASAVQETVDSRGGRWILPHGPRDQPVDRCRTLVQERLAMSMGAAQLLEVSHVGCDLASLGKRCSEPTSNETRS